MPQMDRATSPETTASLRAWEDVLTLVVNPESPALAHRDDLKALLRFALQRAGLEEYKFWNLGRAQRGRLFLSHYSRVSQDLARLEVSAFDVDKLLKERFRTEPLTVGAAWHYGLWRSYFSHAAITHPANDGLREEFSTAWDIVRKHPAVIFRTESGQEILPLAPVRLDLPMIIGPLPHSDGHTLERAYLEAIERADPAADLHVRSLVVIPAASYAANAEALSPYLTHIVLRFTAAE